MNFVQNLGQETIGLYCWVNMHPDLNLEMCFHFV